MIDYLSLAVSHIALLWAFWKLFLRDDLDRDPPFDADSDQIEQARQAKQTKPLRGVMIHRD